MISKNTDYAEKVQRFVRFERPISESFGLFA